VFGLDVAGKLVLLRKYLCTMWIADIDRQRAHCNPEEAFLATQHVNNFNREHFFSWVGLSLSPLGTSATNWSIVPVPDERWWVWSSRWNKNWQGKPKCSEKTFPIATLSTTNRTWPDLCSSPGRRDGKPELCWKQTPMPWVGFEPKIPAFEEGSCLRLHGHCVRPNKEPA
jgi:hypothetical protein